MTKTASQVEIPPPEPALSQDAMVARAIAMRPMLLQEQQATEERSCYSEATHQAFVDAGFYRILQPRRFGGYEFDVETFYRVVIEVARSCPSTGWCLCLGAAHVLQLSALFSEAAQREIFGDRGHFVAPARDLPAGTVRPTDGGYIVDGTWNYCSGAPYSTHFMGVARVANAEGVAPPDAPRKLIMVPRAAFTVLDDWRNMLGLRGSGSNSIRVNQAFIPSHFAVDAGILNTDVRGGTPGFALHGNPMYAGRQLGFFTGEIASIMVGIASAAIDEYERIVKRTKTTWPLPPGLRAEASEYQRPLGMAIGMVAVARAAVLSAARQFAVLCRNNVEGVAEFSVEEDLMLDAQCGHAGRLAYDALELLVRMSGSSNSARNGQRMERYLRDASVFRGHQQGSFVDIMAVELGRVRLGQPSAFSA